MQDYIPNWEDFIYKKSLPSHKAMLYGRFIVFRSGPVPSTPRVALYVTRSLTLAR